jgi:hypothetical protein
MRGGLAVSDFRVICGKCKQPPDVVSNDDGSSQVVCATCARSDNADDALKIASQQYLQSHQPTVQAAMEDGTRGRKFVKFDPKLFPLRTFKWHAEAV